MPRLVSESVHKVSKCLYVPKRCLNSTLKHHYAKVVGGILNQPPPPPPTPLPTYKSVSRPSASSDPFDFDISKRPPSTNTPSTGKKSAPGWSRRIKAQEVNHKDLLSYLTTQTLPDALTLPQLRHSITSLNNKELPRLLPNTHTPQDKPPLTDISSSCLTIITATPDGKLRFSTGFAIEDGSTIVSCLSPLLTPDATTLWCLTQWGTVHGIDRVLTVRIEDDLVLFSITLPSRESSAGSGAGQGGRKMEGVKCCAYPPPITSPLEIHTFSPPTLSSPSSLSSTSFTSSLSSSSVVGGKGKWRRSEVTAYLDTQGREVEPGSYHSLTTLLFRLPFTHTTPVPSLGSGSNDSDGGEDGVSISDGSCGGPIIDPVTKSVVGILRGREFTGPQSSVIKRQRGFGIPAERLWFLYRLI